MVSTGAAATVIISREMRRQTPAAQRRMIQLGASQSSLGVDLGPMPKLQWVEVFDQRTPDKPYRLPVPRLFQRGHEKMGKMTVEAVLLWLSRGLQKPVTAVYTGVLSQNQHGHRASWSLVAFDGKGDESPFIDGATLVICCSGDLLCPDVASKIPVRSSAKEIVLGQLQRLASRLPAHSPDGRGALWRSARARVGSVLALGRPYSPRPDPAKPRRQDSMMAQSLYNTDGTAGTHTPGVNSRGLSPVTLADESSSETPRSFVESGEAKRRPASRTVGVQTDSAPRCADAGTSMQTDSTEVAASRDMSYARRALEAPPAPLLPVPPQSSPVIRGLLGAWFPVGCGCRASPGKDDDEGAVDVSRVF